MTKEELQLKLKRPITKLTTGGFQPTNKIEESWIGKVSLYKEDEKIPVDENGDLMLPLAQFFLPAMPFVPKIVDDTQLLTIFISKYHLPEPFDPPGKLYVIREYKTIDGLISKELRHPESFIKPFPLKAELVENDYPVWDSANDLPMDMMDEALNLLDRDEMKSYEDDFPHQFTHKFGGYRSFCQGGQDFPDGFEFVFQISSDSKAQFNVVDEGSLMFAKNVNSGEWMVYYDFY